MKIAAFVLVALGTLTPLVVPAGVPAVEAGHPSRTNQVVTVTGSGLHIVLVAPRVTYPRGAVVPVTVRMWNSSPHRLPFRWGCHRFAQLHFVTSRSRDLGAAPLAKGESPCPVVAGAVGWLPPHRVWTVTQRVRLLRRSVAAQITPLLHNVDTPGMVDVPFLTRPLTFSLLPSMSR